MDPVDFTKIAQGQKGVANSTELPSPPSRRSTMLPWMLAASAAWAAVAALFEWMRLSQSPGASFSWEGPLAIALDMAWPGVTLLFWPILVVGLFCHLYGMAVRNVFSEAPSYRAPAGPPLSESEEEARDSAESYRLSQRLMAVFWEISFPISLKFGLMAFTGMAVLAGALAAAAQVRGEDPWGAVPWADDNLGVYMARDPGQSVERGAERPGVVLRDHRRSAVTTYAWTWHRRQELGEPCPSDISAEQLGGIPPFPGAPCTKLLRIRNPEGEFTAYFFEITKGGGEEAMKALEAHFRTWAQTQGGSAGSNDGERYTYHTGSSGGKWLLEVRSYQGGATSILVLNAP